MLLLDEMLREANLAPRFPGTEGNDAETSVARSSDDAFGYGGQR